MRLMLLLVQTVLMIPTVEKMTTWLRRKMRAMMTAKLAAPIRARQRTDPIRPRATAAAAQSLRRSAIRD
jgi:hypothetical protein